jgi:hypothetical protein
MSKFSLAVLIALATTAAAGQALALNPQPLPPRWVSPPVHGGNHTIRHVPVVRY